MKMGKKSKTGCQRNRTGFRF